jgi:hypothetical protein
MKRYLIALPNDYNSDDDQNALVGELIPELRKREEALDANPPEDEREQREALYVEFRSELDALDERAFERIHELWPGLELIRVTDFGGVFDSKTPPPNTLPCWAWVTELHPGDNHYD